MRLSVAASDASTSERIKMSKKIPRIEAITKVKHKKGAVTNKCNFYSRVRHYPRVKLTPGSKRLGMKFEQVCT